jgi:hypothetical protein
MGEAGYRLLESPCSANEGTFLFISVALVRMMIKLRHVNRVILILLLLSEGLTWVVYLATVCTTRLCLKLLMTHSWHEPHNRVQK